MTTLSLAKPKTIQELYEQEMERKSCKADSYLAPSEFIFGKEGKDWMLQHKKSMKLYRLTNTCVNQICEKFGYTRRLMNNLTEDLVKNSINYLINHSPMKNKKLKKRTGINTSGLIAQLDDGKKVVLYKTDIGHAGEWIDEILINRNPNAPPPILMADALSSNLPSVIKDYYLSLCNAHARREFVNVFEHFQEKAEWVLTEYLKIWKNNTYCHANDYTKLQRLEYHKANSLPIMEQIRDWGQKHLDSGEIEENSGFGKAINYFLNHFPELTAFCHIEGAQLDNNEMEATLKLIIRGRKNSLFFKTQEGADVADVITSLLATCHKQSVNTFDYLVVLQRHADKVRKEPELWLPWNYTDALNTIESEKAVA